MIRFQSGFWGLLALLLVACQGKSVTLPPFDGLDQDGNANIEWREFHKGLPERTPKGFLDIDLDKNGRISRDEWQAAKDR